MLDKSNISLITIQKTSIFVRIYYMPQSKLFPTMWGKLHGSNDAIAFYQKHIFPVVYLCLNSF